MNRTGKIEGSFVSAIMDVKDITSIGQAVTALETRIGQCLIEIATVKEENKLLSDRVAALEKITVKSSAKAKEAATPT